MIKDLLLGIDIGTTGTKCSIYDLAGNKVATAYQEYPMIHPQDNWTEQNPDQWWSAVQCNLQNIFKTQGIDSSRIAVIGTSSTNAIVFVDKDGKALYNAISLHDQRSAEQVKWLKENIGEDVIHRTAGNRIANGSFSLPNIRWMIENRPDVIEHAHKLMVPCGYVIQKLTGEFSINRSRMSLTLMSNIHTGEWEEEVVRKTGLPERLLPKPYAATEIVGGVTAEAAELTGLAIGTPVTAGVIDTVAATIGAGAVKEGDFALTIGSSGRICRISKEPFQDLRLLNIYGALEKQYIVVQSTNNAGVSLRWFRDVFGEVISKKAEEAGESIYPYLSTVAERAPVGSGGMIWLPYLAGEQSPIWNTKARGVFFHIGLNTDYSMFARAIMEGVAFSQRDCLDVVLTQSKRPEMIPIGGGAANSPIWCQIFADVLNLPVSSLRSNETETLGDIIIAAQAVGLKEIPIDFGKKMAQNGRIYMPKEENVKIYDDQFKKYKELYQALIPLF
jgi:xylulokinase